MPDQNFNPLRIKLLATDDRPREKAISQGIRALTDSELLAVLLGSGSRDLSAVGLAQEMLRSRDHDLNRLSRMTIQELRHFKGVGIAKAVSIAAALELGRRCQGADLTELPIVRGSRDSYQVIGPKIADLNHEEFWVLLLNNANAVMHTLRIGQGGISATIVDPKLVFREALQHYATGIILAHNHPSGSLRPSAQDKRITARLVEVGKLLDIRVLDHLIISQQGYFSFADEGELPG